MNKSTCVMIVALLSGCAATPTFQAANPMDKHLDCSQLAVEMDSANAMIKSARAEKSATSGNIAASLFFWPAAAGTTSQANANMNAAYARRDHLTALMLDKGCPQ